MLERRCKSEKGNKSNLLQMSHDAPEKDMDDFFLCCVVDVAVAVSLRWRTTTPKSNVQYFQHSMGVLCTYECLYKLSLRVKMLLLHNSLIFVIYFVLRTPAHIHTVYWLYCFVYWVNGISIAYWIDDAMLTAYSLCHITPPPHTLSTALISFCTVKSHKTVNICIHTHKHAHKYAHTQTYRIPFCPCAEHFPAFYLLCRNSETAWNSIHAAVIDK